MTGMLNALLDINQIEAGAVRAEIELFPVNDLLAKLRDELAYQAQAKSLVLRMVRCSLSICSDPRLLEQMVRNLLANALKYTKDGKILLGCRRRDGKLSIEVWDTGIGIPDDGDPGDFRGISSGRQRSARALPGARPRPLDRPAPGQPARPSRARALASRQRLRVLD